MTHFDVFNGGADGICALHQLRLAAPTESGLVIGVKRDIALLQRVDAQPGDSVTALDISMAVNRPALVSLLDRSVRVRYFDHHFAGTLPVHPNLTAVIDPSAEVCTAILVDRHLEGRFRIWAVVAAFGDNLPREAVALAEGLRLADPQIRDLRVLGETLSYNGYGDLETDLIVHPAALYRTLHRYADPFDLTERLGTHLVERVDPVRGVEDTRELTAAAVHGEAVVLFPEGTFSRAPGLGAFRLGAFVVSAEANVPIIPIVLRGTRSVGRQHSRATSPNAGRNVRAATSAWIAA